MPVETPVDFMPALKSESWLRTQNADSYLLQLVTARELMTIEDLIDSTGLEVEKLVLLDKPGADGVRTYTLLMGSYVDRQAAESAIRQLNPQLQAMAPWPRKVSAVLETVGK